MTIEQLETMRPLLNMTELARRSGMKPNTLFQKLKRGSEFTVKQSDKIEKALADVGLAVDS